MNSNSAIIDLQKIDKFYRYGETTTKILRAIDLQIHYGESCAIMGTSGSGKSTLMNIMGCLFAQRRLNPPVSFCQRIKV